MRRNKLTYCFSVMPPHIVFIQRFCKLGEACKCSPTQRKIGNTP